MGFKSLHSAVFVDTYYVLNKQNLLRPTKKINLGHLPTYLTYYFDCTDLFDLQIPHFIGKCAAQFFDETQFQKKTKHPERNIDNSVYVLLQFSAPAHYLV